MESICVNIVNNWSKYFLNKYNICKTNYDSFTNENFTGFNYF